MNRERTLIFGIIIGLLIGYLIARIYFFIKIKHQRQDAVTRSRNVVLGNVNEKIAPLLPGFPYHYKDLMFLGKGIDYIVFDGLSHGNLTKIVFLEIKTNSSTLNRNETMIKQCIEQKKVEYQIYRKIV
ncbi:Holliday junction resolvase-like protein [candidate division SR1 bacterium RAAC1_SR1_1]|nr:Holliday junction resolvase-like protein [candidate division SR1 bacterium RAAC1_SR1_1]